MFSVVQSPVAHWPALVELAVFRQLQYDILYGVGNVGIAPPIMQGESPINPRIQGRLSLRQGIMFIAKQFLKSLVHNFQWNSGCTIGSL